MAYNSLAFEECLLEDFRKITVGYLLIKYRLLRDALSGEVGTFALCFNR